MYNRDALDALARAYGYHVEIQDDVTGLNKDVTVSDWVNKRFERRTISLIDITEQKQGIPIIEWCINDCIRTLNEKNEKLN